MGKENRGSPNGGLSNGHLSLKQPPLDFRPVPVERLCLLEHELRVVIDVVGSRAAAAASPGVRPLPLFYAMSQAERAIAAAYLPHVWKLHGHGIKCGDLSIESVLDLEIEPQRGANRSKPTSFRGVTWATDCDAPTEPMKLGALWSALLQVSRLIADVP